MCRIRLEASRIIVGMSTNLLRMTLNLFKSRIIVAAARIIPMPVRRNGKWKEGSMIRIKEWWKSSHMIRRNIIIRRVIIIVSSNKKSRSIMDKEAMVMKRWDIQLEAQEVEVNFITRNIRIMVVFLKRRPLFLYIL